MAVYFESNEGFSFLKTEKFLEPIEECELSEGNYTPRE